jgi:hypothetical protein
LIFPVIWHDTATQVMVDRIKAIFLDVYTELFALPPKDRLGFVFENITRDPPPKILVHQNFQESTKKIIDDLKAGQKDTKAKGDYSHIMKDGYYGIQLEEKHDLDEPMEQVDFLRTWGRSMWLTQ